jgi:hypothetical protein
MKAVEMHYTTGEIATLLRKGEHWVRIKMKAGEFGAVFFFGGDYVATASGVNAFLERHRVESPGVAARTEGEARRKMAARSFNQPHLTNATS